MLFRSAEECASRALLRAERSVAQELRNTVIGYTTVTETSNTVRTDGHEVKYGLLPVWMLYTKWKDKDYLFAMNGQTGKLIGDLPVSVGKFFAWFLGLGSVLSAVAVAVRMLI